MVSPWSIFIGLGGQILSNTAIEFALLGISLAVCLVSPTERFRELTGITTGFTDEYVSLSTRTRVCMLRYVLVMPSTTSNIFGGMSS